MGIQKYFQENINVSRKLILLYIIFGILSITLSIYVTSLMHEQIITAFKSPYPITITATGIPGTEGASASEVWISGISFNDSQQRLSAFNLDKGWEYRNGSILSYENQPAVLEILLPMGTIDITFQLHPWSGIVTIETINNEKEFDLSIHEETQSLTYSVINYKSNTFERVVRLFVVFVLFIMMILLLQTVIVFIVLILKRIGVTRFFAAIITIAVFASIIINFVQFKDVNNPDNYPSGRIREEMLFMRTLYNAHDPDIFRTAANKSIYAAWEFGVHIDIGDIGGSANLIVYYNQRVVKFATLYFEISGIKNVEHLDYDPILLADKLIPYDINNYIMESDVNYPEDAQVKLAVNASNDFVDEFILLRWKDDIFLLLDTSLLSENDYEYIEDLRR